MNILKLRLIIIVVIIMRSAISFSAYAAEDINSELLKMVKAGNVEAVKSLLEGGADVNVKDKNGWTALMLATEHGYRDIVELLLDKGANVNSKMFYRYATKRVLGVAVDFSVEKKTALKLAIDKGNTGLADTLIKSGADDIPNFPWPAPNSSAFIKIPSYLLLNNNSDIE